MAGRKRGWETGDLHLHEVLVVLRESSHQEGRFAFGARLEDETYHGIQARLRIKTHDPGPELLSTLNQEDVTVVCRVEEE